VATANERRHFSDPHALAANRSSASGCWRNITITLIVGAAALSRGSMSVIAFHEKVGRSQGDSFWYLLVTLFSSPPSSPLSPPFHPHSFERFLVRSVQVGCSRFSRCCHLIIDLGSISKMKAGPGD
jgi:hypothetical protein